ncbi:MAG: PRC-barrel domain containing protein [Candidatus Eisenbacteria bacterium]|nr:PRC-barrel domain containing protein [Candidatus Eisenbacteria bacterium]
MLRGEREIQNFDIEARDGTVGRTGGFLFDDMNWTVRYLVVKTGGWLSGRRILISPAAIDEIDAAGGKLRLDLKRQQVENSPDIDVDKPVSRQKEEELHKYYGWIPYWPMALPVTHGTTGQDTLASKEGRGDDIEEREAHKDPDLRGTKEVRGYHIRARDGEIGHVHDFIIDDADWIVRYIVIDTSNWLPGRKVLISPDWIEELSWEEGRVSVDLTKESIQDSPEYDSSRPVERDYEKSLYEYYGRPRYWD